jgi:DNA-binding GntR family transcriptional regulator
MANQSLSPVDGPVSLEKLAYDAIKEAIIAFRLKPGQSLVEADLAQQLAISKTPVRDALLHLEKESLVMKIPYKGTYVSELTLTTMIDVFQIRAVLEGLATYLATPNITSGEIDEYRSLLQEHEQALAGKNIALASAINRRFHDHITQKAGNQRLLQILANLDDHLKRYRTLSLYQSERGNKSILEHRAVLDAIVTSNPQAAEKAMRDHLWSVLEDLSHEDFSRLVEQITALSEKDSSTIH